MAQVISMGSVSRKELPSSNDEAGFAGFKKALYALGALKCCSMRETLTAIENWSESGMLSEREAHELMVFHGWGRK
jgi:hypothetical protein